MTDLFYIVSIAFVLAITAANCWIAHSNAKMARTTRKNARANLDFFREFYQGKPPRKPRKKKPSTSAVSLETLRITPGAADSETKCTVSDDGLTLHITAGQPGEIKPWGDSGPKITIL